MPIVAAAVLAGGCDGLLPPAPPAISSIRIVPETVELTTGDVLGLRAYVLDEDGVAFSGPDVTWVTSAPEVALVSSGGSLSAVAIGFATITATADGVDGFASVTVTGPPVIGLDPSTLDFSAPEGGPNPTAQSVTISNVGDGTLDQLIVGPVAYNPGEPTGWLTSALSQDQGRLTIQVSVSGLSAGSYVATVRIFEEHAANSPAPLTVGLEVTP